MIFQKVFASPLSYLFQLFYVFYEEGVMLIHPCQGLSSIKNATKAEMKATWKGHKPDTHFQKSLITGEDKRVPSFPRLSQLPYKPPGSHISQAELLLFLSLFLPWNRGSWTRWSLKFLQVLKVYVLCKDLITFPLAAAPLYLYCLLSPPWFNCRHLKYLKWH